MYSRYKRDVFPLGPRIITLTGDRTITCCCKTSPVLVTEMINTTSTFSYQSLVADLGCLFCHRSGRDNEDDTSPGAVSWCLLKVAVIRRGGGAYTGDC